MKFTAERDALLRAAQLADAPIKRAVIPAYRHMLIKGSDNHLTLQGASVEIMAAAKCEATVTEAGASSADAADLIKWLQVTPTGCLISGEGDATQLSLSAGRMAATFPAFPRDDFPVMARAEGEEIEGGVAAILECLPFVVKSEARPQLSGVHLDARGAIAVSVINGTAACSIFRDGSPGPGATIPLEGCSAIVKAAKGGGRLFVGENVWRVEAEGLHMTGPLSGLAFPDARRLAGETIAACIVDADSLSGAIEAVTISGGRAVSLKAGDEMELSGDGLSPGVRAATASITCDTIAPFTQAFSAPVIKRALQPFSGRVVTFGYHANGHWQLTAEGAPMVLVMGYSHFANEAPK